MKMAVVKIGRLKAVAGLMWNTQKDQPDARKELALEAQRSFLNAFSESDNFLISIKGVATNVADDYIQYGYVFNEREASGAHSLALLFKSYAEARTSSWVAAFAISENEYWFCTCDNNVIDSETDKVLSAKEINEHIIGFANDGRYDGTIFTDGCVAASLNADQLSSVVNIDLINELQKASKKSKKSKIIPTAINVGKYIVAGFAAAVICAIIGGLYYFISPIVEQYFSPTDKEPSHGITQPPTKATQAIASAPTVQIEQRVIAPQKTVAETTNPPIMFTKSCLNSLDEKIYSPGDWKVEELTCADGKITGTYSYKSDSSKNALEELKDISESYMLLAGNKIIVERKIHVSEWQSDEEPLKTQNLYFSLTGLMQSAGLELTITEEMQQQVAQAASSPAQSSYSPLKKYKIIIKGNGSPIKAAALLSSIPTARIQRINLIDLQKTEIEGEVYATETN